MASSVKDVEQALAGHLVGTEVAGIRVLSASASWSSNPDAEEQSVTVRLIVSDPDPDRGTWELGAADEVRDAVRVALSDSGTSPELIAVTLVPEHPDFGDEAGE